jgi:hypothetical protein
MKCILLSLPKEMVKVIEKERKGDLYFIVV